MNFEHGKNRLREIFEEAIFLDSRPLDKAESKTIEEFWRLSKSEKLLEVLNIIKSVLPDDFVEKFKIKDRIYDINELPFDPKSFSFEGFVGRGGQSRVYFLKSLSEGGLSYVLKMFRESYVKIFCKEESEMAKEFMDEFEEIKGWYSEDLQDIFLPEYLLKLKNPFSKKDTFAVLQPYQGGEIRDVFTEIEKENLLKLLENDTELKEKFVKFVNQTLKKAEKTGLTLDFLGNKNLSIISDNKKSRLVVLDPHHTYKTDEQENNCGQRCVEKLNYLRNLIKEI